jgi:hypothetical protein
MALRKTSPIFDASSVRKTVPPVMLAIRCGSLADLVAHAQQDDLDPARGIHRGPQGGAELVEGHPSAVLVLAVRHDHHGVDPLRVPALLHRRVRGQHRVVQPGAAVPLQPDAG